MTLLARDLTVRIGDKTLIQDVSLTIAPGEILAVVGPNGAGKSTLLNVLCGEMQSADGTVLIENQPLTGWNKRELAKRRAVLPQRSSLTFGFTAQEVVLMGRTPHLSGGESREVAEAMQMTRTTHLAERTYTTLSGGEQQRVQLARVLTQIWNNDYTRYLLLDEPTNNLDLSHQHATLSIARQFAERGVGVLTVLHDLNLAAQYADRILVMKAGQVQAEGIPHAVLTPQTIRDTFGLPVMVQAHPCFDCPLIIPMPITAQQHSAAYASQPAPREKIS